nr:hypothetical protein [uncultured Methanolobus sp.]
MKCKFYDKCEYASSSAMTCSEDGGGSYCGKYRVFVLQANMTCSSSLFSNSFLNLREILS